MEITSVNAAAMEEAPVNTATVCRKTKVVTIVFTFYPTNHYIIPSLFADDMVRDE